MGATKFYSKNKYVISNIKKSHPQYLAEKVASGEKVHLFHYQ